MGRDKEAKNSSGKKDPHKKIPAPPPKGTKLVKSKASAMKADILGT